MSKLHINNASGKEEFLEASREDLRVLIAIRETGSCDRDTLSSLAGISRARASAAITFWREAGVISEESVCEEFESSVEEGISEERSVDVAKKIRDEGLADMITECAVIMKRSALNAGEIAKLTALNTQYSLSPEYIITLAAWYSEKLERSSKKLTVSKLTSKALTLFDMSVDSLEALEEYIRRDESESSLEREFRRLFGIYGRTITPREREYFKKWSSEYGYFTNIVGEAYDISVGATSKLSLPYIDKILTAWYEAGCRTLAECRAKHQEDLGEKAKAKREKAQSKSKKEEPALRYGDFDINDAFQKALARSYGEDNNKESK